MLTSTQITVSATGSKALMAEPFVLIVFGASGDLAHRKVLPAVYSLHADELWPGRAHVVGYGRTEMSDEAFRDSLRGAVGEHARAELHPELWDNLAPRLHYQQGAYDAAGDFTRLRERLERICADEHMPENYLFYLSTPPGQFTKVIEQLEQSGLARRPAPGDGQPWSRVVVEKPFGRDLTSAQQLNRTVRHAFTEKQIYRIDHYLGKETVQNLLVMRFANSIFEPIWNQKYIDHVQITVAETLGVGGRGSYYDQSGALRDMLQNHMMNLLCLIAMEPPSSLSADAIRDEKVKLLHAIRPIPPDCAAKGVVRAQYAPGEIDGRAVAGYLQEEGVPDDSLTDTFIALKLNIDNWRWAGVPFYLRTGKRLARRVTEVTIQFNPVPQVLFNNAPHGPMQPNMLTARIQPDEGISLQFQVKRPGPTMKISPYKMNFSYAQAFGAAPEAYERLLLDAAVGDSTLFIRSDEIEEAWRFVSPILEGCDLQRVKRLPQYPAGSWGPEEAERLVAAEGHRWHISG